MTTWRLIATVTLRMRDTNAAIRRCGGRAPVTMESRSVALPASPWPRNGNGIQTDSSSAHHQSGAGAIVKPFLRRSSGTRSIVMCLFTPPETLVHTDTVR